MSVLSPCYRKHVGARVHHDEEEDPSKIEALQIGVVLHHQVQNVSHLFHQDWVKGQEQLEWTKKYIEIINMEFYSIKIQQVETTTLSR